MGCLFVIEVRGNRINFTQPLSLQCSLLCFFEKRQPATKADRFCSPRPVASLLNFLLLGFEQCHEIFGEETADLSRLERVMLANHFNKRLHRARVAMSAVAAEDMLLHRRSKVN